MKKWSTYEENAKKIDFNKKIEVVLENNIVLSSTIKVSGINESLACLDIEKIKGSKISSFKILENIDMNLLDLDTDEVDVTDNIVDETDFDDVNVPTDYDLSSMPLIIRNSLMQIEGQLAYVGHNNPEAYDSVIDNAINFLKSLKNE